MVKVWNPVTDVYDDYPLDPFADDSAVVHDTGDETIAGVKTFTSDPIIPDEVYGAGWNGSLEVPTKNAVYDKIETLGGGTVDVVSNVATSRILGRITAGSGDSEELTAAQVQELLFPASTSYTPTWSSSAGTPSIGNGTLTGAYLLSGKWLDFRIYLQGGTTTTWGNAGGLYGFSLPAGVTSIATPQAVSAVLFDSSAGLRQGRAAQISASSTSVNRVAADSGAGVGITVPWTWATSDEIIITGRIEVA